ncbi:MAG TPA: glycosyltransferase family 2 protein [Chthonomonadales bacterium]|nr:glycosyltransferase family 2 protein [Chthonomonadales bacterium]
MTAAVVPALNEEPRIARTIRALRAVGGISEVVAVDDGSTDATAREAEAAGARVVRLQRNAGKGAALTAGAGETHADVLLFIDADLEDTAAQASCLLAPVLCGEADMAIARFPIVPGAGGGAGLVVRLARWGIRRATGRTMISPLSGQRALTRAALNRCLPLSEGFGVEVGLTVDALLAGLRVTEIATTMAHRVTGRRPADIRHRARQFVAVCRALWQRRAALLRDRTR